MKNLKDYTDESLVSLYLSGNSSAFDVLLERYQSTVWNYLNTALKNQEQTEDAFQDVFMKVVAYLQAGRYQESGKFFNWLMRIVHNLIIDKHRHSKNEIAFISKEDCEVDILNNSSIAINENRELEMIDQQLHSEVKQLIAMLPEAQREVLLMRYFDDLSFKEIAEKTNCSINTALGRMRYAIMNLKKLALEHGIAC